MTVANNLTTGVLTNVPLPTATANENSVFLRWIMTSNTSVSGSTVQGGGTSRLDDILITGFAGPVTATLTATPATLSFTANTGQSAPASSYALTGNNLAANAPVTIASNSAAVLLSLTGTAPFTQTVTTTTTAAGNLSQTVTVRYTAPAAAGTTNATISNTVGSQSAPVSVTGTAVVPPPTSAGVLLLEEDFDYAAGTSLTAAPATGWQDTEPTNSLLPLTTVAGNLMRAGYPQGIAAVGGGSSQTFMTGGPFAQDIYKNIGAQPTGTTVLYTAALVNVSAAQGGDYFLSLYASNISTSTVYRARVFAKTTTGGFFIGASVDGNPINYDESTVYNLNTPYLVVVKYENSAATGNTDAMSLYVVPAATALVPALEPATPTIGPLASTRNDLSRLDAVLLRQAGNGAPDLTIDNLRVATGWGTAVGRPAYLGTTPTISAGNYYDVTVNTTGAVAPAGAVQVENNLTLTNGLITTTTTNQLTLYPGATVSGGGPTSYVNGPVRRQTLAGAATSVFPVCKDGAYRPLTLTATAQAAPSTYTAEQVNASAGTNVTAPLQRVSTKHYYTVTSSNTATGNFTGTITLSFGTETGQEDYVNTPGSADLVIAKRDGAGPWVSIGRSASTGTDAGAGGPSVAGTLTSASFSDFSDFALGARNVNPANPLLAINPLPVELSTFAAQHTAEGNALAWTTASEQNSAYFEVQRSLDGREFAALGQVAAQGHSSHSSRYAFLDRAKSLSPQAPTYYRLRQVDRDGSASFSPVVAVAGASSPLANVILYPNPAREALRLQLPAVTPYRVLNALGQTLLQGTAEAGDATVRVQDLPAGLYHLELRTPTGRVVRKFVKE